MNLGFLDVVWKMTYRKKINFSGDNLTTLYLPENIKQIYDLRAKPTQTFNSIIRFKLGSDYSFFSGKGLDGCISYVCKEPLVKIDFYTDGTYDEDNDKIIEAVVEGKEDDDDAEVVVDGEVVDDDVKVEDIDDEDNSKK